ncbi:putative serine/threonine protein kinase [Entophlyctis luteolus]|nr:putative serine/threonine protein kinase [Entophlyctis luteolus]KAJ3384557.1 putative serine/threonine protein kinase [Entophlyctis sp. JEL0112]
MFKANVVVAAFLAAASAAAAAMTEVLLVGNNWDGTATIIQSTYPYTKLGLVNLVPDYDARKEAIYLNPLNFIIYEYVVLNVGQGHEQLVDDLYATPDGKSIVASRPSFGDVVSISLVNGSVNWRFAVDMYRADHMAISPDGTKVVVSASVANTVHVLDINTGAQIAKVNPTGDKPHENFFIKNGTQIWNMAIGNVDTALDATWEDWTKGDRHITQIDAKNFSIVGTINMRTRLDAAGYDYTKLSNAIRPATFLPDWSKMYFQVSFFNGVIEYDVHADNITRVLTLPENPNVSTDRTTWLLDSRHHGISMNTAGTKLCVAGTMDNYTTIVDINTFAHGTLVDAKTPYWATINGDSTECVISEAGGDVVTAINFATGEKSISIPVGTHPQRVRKALIDASLL